ncbi:hypothetical protein [Thalassomonas haliotis]|uniref:Uncharacterized protein n=1 Tax=Thalassomonas haliotis TaxID=485448 RepID=A0ABY7VBS6_9GAMM|nr:hypothetical protein [Thalassomonas haliotis]WDE11039.1 hypothetical protein H3N35_22820 [Thalassomonas haliotis]
MKYVLYVLITLLSTSTVAESSKFFHEQALPSNAGDFGNKSSHRYGDHLFGYLHLHSTMNGQQYARILLSDGTRNDTQFYGSLICKDKSGNVIDVLQWNRRLGASIKTMEHNYVFKVTCPGEWGVSWGKANFNVNYGKMTEALSKAAIIWISG